MERKTKMEGVGMQIEVAGVVANSKVKGKKGVHTKMCPSLAGCLHRKKDEGAREEGDLI